MKISHSHIEAIRAHAVREFPCECCGVIGGVDDLAMSVYGLRNVANNKFVEYEADAKDLFDAHREMRRRGEDLIAIYHSHPNQREPRPSETDVRRAFYVDAVYFIVGFDGSETVVRAFRIYESANVWESCEFEIIDEIEQRN